ncbi:MAG: hypothetical protein IKH97_04265 [Bacteroidales bacterium]|nr:hypothetical protein [Bacteroidales bacterium]
MLEIKNSSRTDPPVRAYSRVRPLRTPGTLAAYSRVHPLLDRHVSPTFISGKTAGRRSGTAA